MTVFLVRHADAVSRHGWTKDDESRPLTPKGFHQAAGLVDLLGEHPITRVLSSSMIRCHQTIEPLAGHLGVEIEDAAELFEGTPVTTARKLLDRVASEEVVLCSHGDVIPDLIHQLEGEGVRMDGRADARKGSTWVLETKGGRVVRGRYLPAP